MRHEILLRAADLTVAAVNDSTLSKLWSSIALVALYCAVNGVADIQGSSFLLPFVHQTREEVLQEI